MIWAVLVLLVLLFGVTWWVALKIDNYSIVDAVWSFSFGLVVLIYAFFADGWVGRVWLMVVCFSLWSLRLGYYLSKRIASHHPEEDRRYMVLREKWKDKLKLMFFWFFEAQALLVWSFTLLLYFNMKRAEVGFSGIEIMGCILFVIALVGEGVADAQLRHFKLENKDQSAVCEDGLWAYSRHPNYFFQSLLWWGAAFMCAEMAYGLAGFAAPLIMTHFLVNVTGIPLTEKLAVETKGEAYVSYQKRVSAFVIWPFKKQ